ncbi:unnamed protein product [Clonostachys rosea]|uniref:Cytochrome P450 n=1 Tax=Bionectria ochroleuca TaxID=29856 RepID=A0ABY6V008_BIOOC|nr:unnamed protein product [Clonostachys rosea]
MDPLASISTKISWLWVLTHIVAPGLILSGLYRYLTDPLKRVPGPFIAKFTGAWMLYIDLSGQRSATVHRLHKIYGPAVRVGPSEVCFASPAALKEIYGANSKYFKAPVYDSLGFRSTFTTRNRDEYREMKKRIVSSFSSTSISEIEPVVHRQLDLLVKGFDKRVDQPLNVLPWFRMLALGVVGEGFADDSFGGLENEKLPELLNHIDEVFPVLWTKWMFPVTTAILEYAPIKPVQSFLQAAPKFKKYCSNAYQNYLATHNPSEHHDLIARMVNEQKEIQKRGEVLPFHVTDDGIVQELTNLMFAGTDTTGTTLTYLFWELARHPEWIVKLREELNEALQGRDTFSYHEISELPVLEAVIQEILRLRPAGPSGLQRLTPEEGAVVDGVSLPGRVIVSCQAMSSQREATIFEDPDCFNPQRWLDGEKNGNADIMREQILVFGKGARACLGRRLATMELKCAAAIVARRYNVKIGSPTTDDDMEMTDHFVLIPKGGKCLLELSRV